MKKIISFVLVCLLTAGAFTGIVTLANTFSDDVPESHWAYGAIDRVTELGLMTGKTISVFDVNGWIGKFETSKILATLAGFKTIGASQEDLSYYEYCYDKHFITIEQYSRNFAKWAHEYDYQIAYLLELGVFMPPDLENFLIIQNGSEQQIALLRFDICIFMARLLGDNEVARSFVPTERFADDENIAAASRPYVYYMRHIGVVSGDNLGNFNPNSPIVRSAMAVMLDKMVDLIGFGNGASQNGATQNQGQAASFETLSGVITQIYPSPSFRAIEVQNTFNGQKKIYHVLNTANITVNADISYFDMLEPGMDVAAVVVDGEIAELIALKAAVRQYDTYDQTNVGLDSVIIATSDVEGTVGGVRTSGGAPYIDLLVKTINLKGEIVTETRTFLIDPACAIYRDVNITDYLGIVTGDLAKLTISGTSVYKIYLEEKYRSIYGTVVGKRTVEATGMGVFSVEDAQGRVHELVTTNKTVVTRAQNAGTPTWKDIRIGDSVEVSAEYDAILSVAATGLRSFVDVFITKVVISQNGAELSGMSETGVEKTYPIISKTDTDPYTLRVGSKVRLTLDSLEVENILMLESPVSGDVTGHIVSISGNSIVVSDDNHALSYGSYNFDSNTIVMDSVAGARVSLSHLTRDMKVYIVYDPNNANYISTITILSY